MKTAVLILMISILTITGCYSQQTYKFTNNESVLDFYKLNSPFTDPGEYAYLYKNLPDSLPELCQLIKTQIIHPWSDLSEYSDQIPKERSREDFKYPTVKSILEGLLSYDSSGLIKNRKPEDRLLLTCRYNAILLASILKYRGIPVRVRYGFAPYIESDFHVGHVICEVWNTNENRWMLVDPTMNMVDFSRNKFDFSNNVWEKLMNKEIDSAMYGVMGLTGESIIVSALNLDIASLLGTEFTYLHYSPIIKQTFKNEGQLSVDQIQLLNKISKLMTSINAKSLSELKDIYNNNSQIQITKTFELDTKTSENNTKAKSTSINKPDIEFVDIPGGTFMMGSPVTEQGRKDDEIQHKVTLSAFRMSKYCVTLEQYDAFCEATGRNNPWGIISGNMAASQVTWYDAEAFAEWMGCRLLTEAEWEYAARANTSTPFYTGDCLTSEQANFNGKEPYINCEKSEYRNKPLPVGSFPPNAFGLYDMHGNLLEWTNDWYAAYILNDTLNPKGPDTGSNKVYRGGGYRDEAWKCRSAYRGGNGLSPGTRGTGIGFRIVKDK
jgi:sulfatase modifying factor 1